VSALLWSFSLLAVAAGVNIVGIRTVGDVDKWSLWLSAHGHWFLAWRLCLYGLTTWGWWWMRERIRIREPGAEALSRLRRMEIAGLAAILVVECVTFAHTR
jgi:hypothetical protein